MPFKLPHTNKPCLDDPEALFRDLRRKTVPGLLSHQAAHGGRGHPRAAPIEGLARPEN